MHYLTEYRERQGFTQDALAERIGITQSHLSAIERGTRLPSLGVLKQLCLVLGLSPEERLKIAGLAETDCARSDGPQEAA